MEENRKVILITSVLNVGLKILDCSGAKNHLKRNTERHSISSILSIVQKVSLFIIQKKTAKILFMLDYFQIHGMVTMTDVDTVFKYNLNKSISAPSSEIVKHAPNINN